MLGALFRKQFMELNAGYFQDRKTGKRRSAMGIIGYVALFLLVFVSLGMVFFELATGMESLLNVPDLQWIYFCIMGSVSVLLGVFGSVFNTYAGLYQAKDNEMLLAMPIAPWKILLVRLTGVYAMGLLYESIVMVPTLLVFWMKTPLSVSRVVCPILLWLLIGLLILFLTCLLGFLVALIAGKLKNKSFATLLLSLAFIAGYYFVYFKAQSALRELVAKAALVGEIIRNSAYPLYLLGRAGVGNWTAMGVMALSCAVLIGLLWWGMSRTFLRLAIRQNATEKVKYREKEGKVNTVEAALLHKEWKRFTSSANYMLNCALGTLLMPVAAIALFVMKNRVTELLTKIPVSAEFIPVLATAAIMAIASMNDTAAPSVSLEGRNLWMVQSMPIPAQKVLHAKMRLQQLLTIPPVIFLCIAVSVVLKIEMVSTVLMTAVAVVYAELSSAVGLWMDLRHANVTWTSEIVPIKQSLNVFVCLMGGMGFSAAMGLAGYFALQVATVPSVLAVILAVLVLLTRFLNRWIDTRGVDLFRQI